MPKDTTSSASPESISRSVLRINRFFREDAKLPDELALILARVYDDVTETLVEALTEFRTHPEFRQKMEFSAMWWLYHEFPWAEGSIMGAAFPGLPPELRIQERKRLRQHLDAAGYIDFIVEELRAMPYSEYLQTPHWQGVKNAALQRADHHCQLCGGEDHLQVHHNNYERRGYERNSDVIVLCSSCHRRFHQDGQVY